MDGYFMMFRLILVVGVGKRWVVRYTMRDVWDVL